MRCDLVADGSLRAVASGGAIINGPERRIGFDCTLVPAVEPAQAGSRAGKCVVARASDGTVGRRPSLAAVRPTRALRGGDMGERGPFDPPCLCPSCPSVRPSARPFVRSSVRLAVRPSGRPFIRLVVRSSVWPSACQFGRLSSATL